MDKKEIIFILLSGSFIIAIFCFALIFFVLYYMKRKKLHQTELQTEILRTELLAIDKTSTLISREIHDHVAQHLSVACILLQEAELEGEKLRQTYKLVDDSMEELRKLSRVLTAHHIGHIQLTEALQQEIDLYKHIKNTRLELIHKIGEIALSQESQLMLLRIGQEAISNAVKHSSASLIQVTCIQNTQEFIITVRDNGKGFDPDQSPDANGLHNIRQRAKYIEAKLEIITAPGEGTELRVIKEL